MKNLIRTLILAVLTITIISAGSNSTERYEKSFDVKPGGTLRVDVNLGAIHIETWNKNVVKIVCRSISEKAIQDISIVQSDNEIEFNFASSYGYTTENFTFYAPEKFNIKAYTNAGAIDINGSVDGNVDLNTSGGRIYADDINGNAKIQTSGGQIRVLNVKGDLTAETMGGDVDVENIDGDRSVIKTMGGKIYVGNAKNKLNAVTYGGNIRAESVGDGSSLETYGGDIKIRKFNGDVALSTGGGDLYVFDGKGFIEAHTSGGDIDVKKIKGGANLKTGAGSIYANIDPDGLDSELKSSFGDIELTIPKNADVKVTARIRSNLNDGYEIVSNMKEKENRERHSSVEKVFISGNGKNNIKLNTTNSDIIIRQK